MIIALPEKIEASDGDLRSLSDSLIGYGVSKHRDKIWGVWLLRRDMLPLLVVSDSRDIVFKFEAFTLALRTAQTVLLGAIENSSRMSDTITQLGQIGSVVLPSQPLPEHLEPDETYPWPFTDWRVEVLWELDWTIPIERVSDEWWAKPDTKFGAFPANADHICMVAKSLLFTGTDGSQLLIGQGEMPLDLLVTSDRATIVTATIGTLAVAVDRYLTGPDPSV